MAESTRDWLINNGYPDEAAKIDAILRKWKDAGIKTRRNWWAVIAGTIAGNPVTVGGIEFLVIKAARDRMGMKPSKHATSLKKNELAPIVEKQIRWKGIKKKIKK